MPVDQSVQRHEALLQHLRAHGRVDTSEAAVSFEVSTETVRKDLLALESRGLLRRVHGGAVPLTGSSVEPDVSTRIEFTAEKRRIAQAALDLLPRTGSLLLDAGSTVAELAAMLPTDRDLTIFTNAVPIALALVSNPRLTVNLLGGRLRSPTLATVDSWAARQLDEITADVAFLGTNGIDLARGLTTPDLAEADIKRMMTKAARRRVLLADHSKYGQVSLVRHAQLSDIDVLVTDTGLGAREAAAVRRHGPEVQRA